MQRHLIKIWRERLQDRASVESDYNAGYCDCLAIVAKELESTLGEPQPESLEPGVREVLDIEVPSELRAFSSKVRELIKDLGAPVAVCIAVDEDVIKIVGSPAEVVTRDDLRRLTHGFTSWFDRLNQG